MKEGLKSHNLILPKTIAADGFLPALSHVRALRIRPTPRPYSTIAVVVTQPAGDADECGWLVRGDTPPRFSSSLLSAFGRRESRSKTPVLADTGRAGSRTSRAAPVTVCTSVRPTSSEAAVTAKWRTFPRLSSQSAETRRVHHLIPNPGTPGVRYPAQND